MGHETDFTISDFAADMRAPTPSAAAELCVPDLKEMRNFLYTVQNRMFLSLAKKVDFYKERVLKISDANVLRNPERILEKHHQNLLYNSEKLCIACENAVAKYKERYIKSVTMLDSLSPLKVLKRGYSFVETSGGQVIDTVHNITEGNDITLKFADGKAGCKVMYKEEYNGNL